jgi:hypothetical protein
MTNPYGITLDREWSEWAATLALIGEVTKHIGIDRIVTKRLRVLLQTDPVSPFHVSGRMTSHSGPRLVLNLSPAIVTGLWRAGWLFLLRHHTSSRSLRISTRIRGEPIVFENVHTDGRR